MEQIENNIIREGSDEFWRNHILLVQNFRGSNREYCRINGINHRIFSFHKRRLGFGKPRKSKEVFVELKTKSTNVDKSAQPIEVKRRLPDAKWVAEFAGYFVSQFR